MYHKQIQILLSLIGLLNFQAVFAQYTLVLIDRPYLKADSVKLGPEFLEYRKQGQEKIRLLERDKLFAIRHADGREEIVYLPDSLEGNWYTVDQMRDYLQGQEDARKGYRKRANRGAFAGVLIGGGASISRLYGSLAIAAYPGFVGYLKPAFSEKYGYKVEMAENAYYREGYGTMAKRLATRRAFWGTLSGYIAGSIVFAFVFQ